MSGGHGIPFNIPIQDGLALIKTGWDMLEEYEFVVGGITLNMKIVFFGIILTDLAAYALWKILDWG